ncbi:MAG: hypothetical protein CMH32_06435 [Micavibrio sp.]|nr:hypothetical protein [Micavibrio sp.]|tara:strand:- start:591 stop:857 length:267 start_codon:yes stop_codon:yes gene_type:complete
MFKRGSLSRIFLKSASIAAVGLFTAGYSALCAGEHFINNSFDMDFAIAAARLWAGVSLAFGAFTGGMFTGHRYQNRKERDERMKNTFD